MNPFFLHSREVKFAFGRSGMRTIASFDRIGEENAFAVLARAGALAAQGKDIINLGIGQPDFPTPKNIVDVASLARFILSSDCQSISILTGERPSIWPAATCWKLFERVYTRKSSIAPTLAAVEKPPSARLPKTALN